MRVTFLVAVSLAVGALRLALPPHGLHSADIFKDLAHLWVGGLWGAAVARWRFPLLWGLALGLTLLEVVAFFSK